MSVTVEFLRANAPHGIGERASFPRDRAAALIRAGVARLPPDTPGPPAPAAEEAVEMRVGGRPARRTGALRRYDRKA